MPAHIALAHIEDAIRSSFERDTCSEDDLPEWGDDNRSRGHCAMAALTLHDFLGGELLCAEVHRDGKKFGYHWWNRIDGAEVDFTRDQFSVEEVVQKPWTVERPPGDGHLYGAQHAVFRQRVQSALRRAGRL